jgi:putative acetyltransferase
LSSSSLPSPPPAKARPLPPGVAIRDARDDDAADLIELIGGVFVEYPGCVLDVDGEMPELRAIATSFRSWGGRFWVVERGARVIGCVGLTPSVESPDEGVELRKLYVDKTARGIGLGGALCDCVEGEARAFGKTFVELWSDTRFETAHRVYERRGYVRGPHTRDLHDKSASVEFYYRLSLKTPGVADRASGAGAR